VAPLRHAVAQILRDIAAEALEHCGSGLLVGLDYFSVVFWVELAREGRRVHEITEHHHELVPFGVMPGRSMAS
jgi:hypothetical protein